MPTHDSWTIQSPSRLHFGLFGGQSKTGLSYGGIGAMIDKPGLSLSIEPNASREYSGVHSDRLQTFAESWISFAQPKSDQGFHLSISESPESHIGLGTGTQIGLSVSTLLFQFYFQEIPSVDVIAKSVQRGLRSAVGTYGFLHGGFILDQGKKPGDDLAKLGVHFPIPESWRFVLIRAANPVGLSGSSENQVFTNSVDQMQRHHDRLVTMAKNSILPALAQEDFDEFSEGLYEFGKISGSYFAESQGGEFNGPRITQLIEDARNLQIKGVGQSSWGPTLYLLCESEEEANRIEIQMSEYLLPEETVTIAAPQNCGFQLEPIRQTTP